MVRRILIVAPHLGALTPLANELEELGALGSYVHIAVEADAPPGTDVSVFRGRFRRITVGPVPEAGASGVLGRTVRATLDCWRFLPVRNGDGSYHRALEQAPSLAAYLADSSLLRSNLVRPLAARVLAGVDRALPPSKAIVEFLRALSPELLIVVPLFTIGSSAADYLRAAGALRIATFGMPLRWDDLTHGAALHERPGCLALWNRDQRRHAIEHLGVPARRTAVIGAPLPLDVAGTITTTRAEVCDRLGLDPARALVLFAGHGDDAQRVEAFTTWARTIRCSEDARVRSAQALVYWPPAGGVYQRAHAAIHDALVIPRQNSKPAGYRLEIAEVLHHADAVVATDMTVVLEAAARARPVLALLSPGGGDGELARFCAQEPDRGWPFVARSLDEHATQLGHVLDVGCTPEQQVALRAPIRPHGPRLTPGFLAAARLFKAVVDRRAPASPATLWPVRRALLRPLAALAAWRAAGLPKRREPRSQARILVGVPGAETLQIHQPLLQALVERGHRIHIVFTARRSRAADYYALVKTDVPGIHTTGVLLPPEGFWARVARGLLGLSAFASLLEGRQERPSPRWLVRYASVVLPAGTRRLAWLARTGHRTPARLRRVLARLERAIAPSAAARELLLREKPDVVVMLPEPDLVSGFDSAEAQADLLRASTSLGIHTVALAVAADSNVHATMLQPGPATVLVWNEAQRAQVLEGSQITDARVSVTGAALLDRSLAEPPSVDPDQFREILGLPQECRFALYVGSPGPFIDADAEVKFVSEWIRSLRADSRPALSSLPVLLRPPINRIGHWQRLDFRDVGGVVMCPRHYDETGELDTALLTESIRYASVTVGFDGFSLVLAGTLDRPAVATTTVAGSGRAQSSSVPLQWLWTAPGSTVRSASTLEDVNARIMAILDEPAAPSPSASGFQTHVTPVGGRRPTFLVADHIEHAARRSERYQRSPTWWSRLATRGPLLLLTAVVASFARFEPAK